MLTIKTKKAVRKITVKPKTHSLLQAFGAAKEKGFNMDVKSRENVWKR
jgi:hypothetical protein